MEFFDEQKDVVDEKIGNILVSAAAGSGKTTVLVGRIIKKILLGELSIDRILVVTFTKEAAANMKKKITAAINDEIKNKNGIPGEEDTVKKLQKQLDLLPNSYIQTIDAFCLRVIKEKGYVISDSKQAELLESGNTILDENTLGIILREAIAKALEESYQCDDYKAEGFKLLTAMFGDGRTNDTLASNIENTYRKLRSLPDYMQLCRQILEKREQVDKDGIILGYDAMVEYVLSLFTGIDDAYIAELDSLVDSVSFVKDDSKNDEYLEANHLLLEHIKNYVNSVKDAKEQGDSFQIVNAITNKTYIDKFISDGLLKDIITKNPSEEHAEFVDKFGKVAALLVFISPLLSEASLRINKKDYSNKKGYLNSAAPYLINKEYATFLYSDVNELLCKQKTRTKIVKSYIEIIKKVDANYLDIKTVIHGMDFPDQSHIAKKILENSDAGEYYREKFLEIYVDEYQDNSDIQDAIIDCFARPSGNVFRVGDVKQSIYKFRFANPYMFLNKMNLYDFDREQGHLMTLNNNYRSNNQILDFINNIFTQIMSRDGAEIEYDDKQALHYPEKIKEKTFNSKPNVIFVEKGELDSRQADLVGVKSEVQRLINSGKSLSDICILAAKKKTANNICKFLTDEGYKAQYADEIAIFEDQDIHGIVNIIVSLGNLYRNEYLLGVLLGHYCKCNFTLDEISRIVLFVKKSGIEIGHLPLYSQLEIFVNNPKNVTMDDYERLCVKVKDFLNWINDLRSQQIITDIGELIDRIYRDTGVLARETSTTDKFVLFKDWLCSNFMRYGSDISLIANNLENMKIKLGGGTSVRESKKAKENAITCMTYHSSKGLEFDSVIITGLDERFPQDTTGAIKFDPEAGFAVNDYSEKDISIKDSIERVLMNESDVIKDNSEDIRLLYVILTRAKVNLSVIFPFDPEEKAKNTIYQRLHGLETVKIPRLFWLNTATGIDNSFFAGLLRLKGASKLENLFSARNEISSRCKVTINYDDFDLTYLESNTNKPEGNPSDVEDESLDDDVVDIPVDSFSSELIPLAGIEEYDENNRPVFKPYKYEKSSITPFKVSVSQIKEDIEIDASPISLAVNDLEYYLQKQTGKIGESASEVGTFVHSIMRFIDMEQISNGKSSVSDEIDVLINDGIIDVSDKEKAMEFEKGIDAFSKSIIGGKLIKSDKRSEASYEKPIVFSVPKNDDKILVQGIIDCIFKDDDGKWILIDYKSDTFADGLDSTYMANIARKKHKTQINAYAAAMESSGYKIKEKYVYLIRYGVFVKID